MSTGGVSALKLTSAIQAIRQRAQAGTRLLKRCPGWEAGSCPGVAVAAGAGVVVVGVAVAGRRVGEAVVWSRSAGTGAAAAGEVVVELGSIRIEVKED